MRWDYYHHSPCTDMKTEALKISLKSARKWKSWESQIPTTDVPLIQCVLKTYLMGRPLGPRPLTGRGSLPALLILHPCFCLS